MVRVWDINIDQILTWKSDDVASKCYVFPSDRNQRSLNPVPKSVRNAATSAERQEFFNEVFDKNDDVSWVVHSLLLPHKDTIATMVNVELREEEMDDSISDRSVEN